MEFKASLDKFAKVATICMYIILLLVFRKEIKHILSAHGDMTHVIYRWTIIFIGVAIGLGTYLFSTTKYAIQNEELIIKRPIMAKKIAINDIAEVRAVNPDEMKGSTGLGVHGFFGYYGTFWNKTLGTMHLYATQRRNRVYILTKNRKIIVTPDDITSFIESIKKP